MDYLFDKFHGVEERVVLAVIYCDYRATSTQTTVNILGSILQQFLVQSTISLPPKITETLRLIENNMGQVEMKDIRQMFELSLSEFEQAFICVDALDEAAPRTRYEVLTFLKEFNKVRLLLTARPRVQPDINHALEISKDNERAIEIIPSQSDIQAYLVTVLESDNKSRFGLEIASDLGFEDKIERLNCDIIDSLKANARDM